MVVWARPSLLASTTHNFTLYSEGISLGSAGQPDQIIEVRMVCRAEAPVWHPLSHAQPTYRRIIWGPAGPPPGCYSHGVWARPSPASTTTQPTYRRVIWGLRVPHQIISHVVCWARPQSGIHDHNLTYRRIIVVGLCHKPNNQIISHVVCGHGPVRHPPHTTYLQKGNLGSAGPPPDYIAHGVWARPSLASTTHNLPTEG